MGQKLIAYRESIAASVTDNDTNAVAGQGDLVVNAHHVLDRPLQLVGAYSGGLGAIRSTIAIPQISDVAPVDVRPLNRILLPPTDYNFADYRRKPVPLAANQEIRNLVTTDGTVGPNNYHTALILSDGDYSIPAGDSYVIRATGATTLVAGAYTLVNLTYANQLPPGVYYVIGCEVISATGIFWRIVSTGYGPGQTWWRPGGICLQDEGQSPHYSFFGFKDPASFGGYGILTQFQNVWTPQIEVLANAADTAQVVYFHLIGQVQRR